MCAILLLKALRLAHANERSHSFTCHPHVYPHSHPAFTPQPQHITTFWATAKLTDRQQQTQSMASSSRSCQVHHTRVILKYTGTMEPMAPLLLVVGGAMPTRNWCHVWK